MALELRFLRLKDGRSAMSEPGKIDRAAINLNSSSTEQRTSKGKTERKKERKKESPHTLLVSGMEKAGRSGGRTGFKTSRTIAPSDLAGEKRGTFLENFASWEF